MYHTGSIYILDNPSSGNAVVGFDTAVDKFDFRLIQLTSTRTCPQLYTNQVDDAFARHSVIRCAWSSDWVVHLGLACLL